jgi:Uma2 family endonuclease
VVTARDVLLIVEVSDSSLRYDRREKLPRYAATGVPEVWLVDLVGEQVEQYWLPGVARFGERSVAGRGGTVSSVMLPALRFSVDELLG